MIQSYYKNYSFLDQSMIHIDISHLNYTEAMKLIQESCPSLSTLHVIIDFWVDHSQSKIIRDFIGQIFDINMVSPPWKGRFVLITDELLNNAIEHGSTAGDLDTCIIEAGRHDDGCFYITLEVHDTGTGVDSVNAKDMMLIKQLHACKRSWNDVYMEKRGRGLFDITEKLVDRLEFTRSPKGWLAVKIMKVIL